MQELGTPAHTKRMTWVQTDKKTHEEWGRLAVKKPAAAGLLHILVSKMGNQNAIVVSQELISKLMGCSVSTVKRAIKDLENGNWIQVVSVGKGATKAYVVNAAVAWGQSRDQLHTAVFAATVIADIDDQAVTLNELTSQSLKKIPTLYPGERQLPSGEGLEPPSQPHLDGLEPDLPVLNRN
jgi:hypothetical protein